MRYFRKLQNMTQNDLSDASNINPVLIRKYETGTRNPKFDQLKTIADALGVSVLEFLEYDLKTVGDIISLIQKLDTETSLQITGQKDASGNYIPSTMTLSFKDEAINTALADYLSCKEESSTAHKPEHIVTDNEKGIELTIENQISQMLLNDREIKKPEG